MVYAIDINGFILPLKIEPKSVDVNGETHWLLTDVAKGVSIANLGRYSRLMSEGAHYKKLKLDNLPGRKSIYVTKAGVACLLLLTSKPISRKFRLWVANFGRYQRG